MKKFLWLLLSHAVVFGAGAGVMYYQLQSGQQRLERRLSVYQDSLDQAQRDLASLRKDLATCQLRGLVGQVLIHVQEQNYGSARQAASLFFDRTSQLLQQEQLPDRLATTLRTIERQRDEIIADLAALNPRVEKRLREIYLQLSTQ